MEGRLGRRHLYRGRLACGDLSRGGAEPAAHPRHRDREPAQGLLGADFQGGRPRRAEHSHAHHQARQLQRLRGRRAQRVHEYRRAHAGPDTERGDRRHRPRDRPHHRRPHGGPARPDRPRCHQEPAADHPRHRPDGGRRRGRRRHGTRGGRCRRRPGHGRQRHPDALASERAPGPGICGRPGWPALPRRHPAVGARHARNLRAFRRAGVLVCQGHRPVRAQPSGGGDPHQSVARQGRGKRLRRCQGCPRAAVPARHDAGKARRPYPAGCRRRSIAIRQATPACPRATHAPSPATARAIARRRSARSTRSSASGRTIPSSGS